MPRFSLASQQSSRSDRARDDIALVELPESRQGVLLKSHRQAQSANDRWGAFQENRSD